MVKVSIIVPIYNTEKYLRECLDSLINQTLKDIEIICINDGSTDNSAQILEEYAKKDSRIIIINQENKGAGFARNQGIRIAKGEYLGFVDSDDYVDLTFFENLYNATKKEAFDIIMTSNVKLIKENEQIIYKPCGISEEKTIKSLKEKSNLFIHTGISWNKIYKTAYILKNNIYYTEINSASEDLYFTFFNYVLAKKIYALNNTTYYYRQIDTSQTKTIKNEKSFKIIDFCQIIDEKLENLNINIFAKTYWKKIFKQRREIEFLMYYSNMHKDYRTKFQELWKKTYPKDNIKEPIKDLIISLTSYPARINCVHKAIESIMLQSIEPEKIILVLSQEEFPNKEQDLPDTLLNLIEKGLEILWSTNIKSFKKLLPTLEKYPNKIIVTADDDIIYQQDWLEKLYKAYLKKPRLIHCHRAHRIIFNQNKEILNYKNWIWEISNVSPSFNNFLTSGAGVIFSKKLFYKDILEKDIFMTLCPTADDIWFWTMSVMNGTKINIVKDNISILNTIHKTQEDSLWKINENQNDVQLKKVFEYYPEILKKLDKRKFTPFYLKIKKLKEYQKLVKEKFVEYKLKKILNTKKDKILLWGASLYIEDFIKKNKINNPNILAIIDKNSNKWGKNLEGYKIYSPEQIKEFNANKILLTIKNSNEIIYSELKFFVESNHPKLKLLPNIFKI